METEYKYVADWMKEQFRKGKANFKRIIKNDDYYFLNCSEIMKKQRFTKAARHASLVKQMYD